MGPWLRHFLVQLHVNDEANSSALRLGSSLRLQPWRSHVELNDPSRRRRRCSAMQCDAVRLNPRGEQTLRSQQPLRSDFLGGTAMTEVVTSRIPQGI